MPCIPHFLFSPGHSSGRSQPEHDWPGFPSTASSASTTKNSKLQLSFAHRPSKPQRGERNVAQGKRSATLGTGSFPKTKSPERATQSNVLSYKIQQPPSFVVKIETKARDTRNRYNQLASSHFALPLTGYTLRNLAIASAALMNALI